MKAGPAWGSVRRGPTGDKPKTTPAPETYNTQEIESGALFLEAYARMKLHKSMVRTGEEELMKCRTYSKIRNCTHVDESTLFKHKAILPSCPTIPFCLQAILSRTYRPEVTT
jgi:hypothetical protein